MTFSRHELYYAHWVLPNRSYEEKVFCKTLNPIFVLIWLDRTDLQRSFKWKIWLGPYYLFIIIFSILVFKCPHSNIFSGQYSETEFSNRDSGNLMQSRVCFLFLNHSQFVQYGEASVIHRKWKKRLLLWKVKKKELSALMESESVTIRKWKKWLLLWKGKKKEFSALV